jgi:hypothetical protein
MKAVAFVQERRSRRIIGAATIELYDNEREKLATGSADDLAKGEIHEKERVGGSW